MSAMTMTPEPTRRSTAPLFLLAEFTSSLGNAAIGITLPWLVLQRTGEASITGLVAGVAAAPAVVAAVVGGQLVDRVGQKRMSVLSDLGSAASVAALAVVDRAAGLTVSWFVVLGVLGALFDVPGITARETMMGRVSATSGIDLDRLAGLRQLCFGIAFLGGPALAGVLLTVTDPINVVWLTAVCSLLGALTMQAMPLRGAEQRAEATEVGGWGTIRRTPALRVLVVLAFGGALVTAPLQSVVLPAHFAGLGEPGWFGYAISGFAVGALLGAAAYSVVGPRSRRAAYVAGILVISVGLAGCASLQGLLPVAAGMVLVGLGNGLLSPVLIVFFVEDVPESVRGRVLGMFNAVTLIAAPLALGASALLLSALSLGGLALLLLAVWGAVAVFSLRGSTLSTLARSGPPRPDEETIGAHH
jgi:MFS family permease